MKPPARADLITEFGSVTSAVDESAMHVSLIKADDDEPLYRVGIRLAERAPTTRALDHEGIDLDRDGARALRDFLDVALGEDDADTVSVRLRVQDAFGNVMYLFNGGRGWQLVGASGVPHAMSTIAGSDAMELSFALEDAGGDRDALIAAVKKYGSPSAAKTVATV